MGRTARPISIRRATGTLLPRHRIGVEVPDKPLGLPPKWFNAVMRAEWSRLAALPHIKQAHRTACEHLCALYSEFVLDAKGGKRKRMGSADRQVFHSLTMQLGLTPSAQTKVHAEPEPKPNDVWDQF